MSYRHLLPEEYYIGFKCQKRVYTEYDTEVCSSGPIDYLNLTDELDWLWKDHIITEEDLTSKYKPSLRVKL